MKTSKGELTNNLTIIEVIYQGKFEGVKPLQNQLFPFPLSRGRG